MSMEKLKNHKNYSISLDLGTASVGWAVMNDDYSLVRKSGINLWGANLFDEGQTAESRRLSRGNRRRLERRKQRINLLQTLMQEDVLKADDSFFIRLEQSFLHNGDFGRKHKYNLFNDADFTDKDFYKKYPTIYHLRKALIESDKRFDIRLVYLAIHHIIKYRGNFLYEGSPENFNGYDINMYSDFFEELSRINGNQTDYQDKIKDIENILSNTSLRRKEKVDEIKSLFALKEDKIVIGEFSTAVLGLKFSLEALFQCQNIKSDNGKPLTISFSDKDYEEHSSEYAEKVGEYAPLLGELYSIYSAFTFKDILGENKYISSAMCRKYETYKSDFNELKTLMRKYCDKRTFETFYTVKPSVAEIKDNAVCYYNYIHNVKRISDSVTNKTVNQAFIEKVFSLIEKTDKKDALQDNPIYRKLKDEYELREILPRINSKVNSAIPYQMNCKELIKILQNQGKYYPTLKDNAEKIISLLTFKRPYYVGVLNKNSKNNWYDMDINEQVYPWNFSEKVDYELAQEKFIGTLTNNCSIFPQEPVLPLNSFLYSEYKVLNELNKIKIKGKLMSSDTKNEIFKELFLSVDAKAKVGVKDFIEKYIKITSTSVSEKDIEGFTEEKAFANIYKPYRDFSRILGEAFDENKINEYEKIVHTLTVFEDASTRRNRIEKTLQKEIETNKISQKQIQALAKLNYKGWGRFSKKALNGIYSIENPRRTVIQIMRDTTLNFMEIIYDKKFGFQNQMTQPKPDIYNFYEDCIEKSYCSPAVKKSIWQSIKIINEIIKIMGAPPCAVYVESAEGEDLTKKNKRTKSRADRLKELYYCAKKTINEQENLSIEQFNKVNAELSNKIKDNKSSLDREKLYLYFSQLGKCMYSGEKLNVSDLDKYEVDHIIPRSIIKDNSLENKVLVKKIENQNKANNLTLNQEIIDNMKPFWSFLLKKGFIGKKKFDSLTRETFDESDVDKFINRQLVETRQAVKSICEIIKYLPSLNDAECKIIKVKAKLCDDLKESLGYYKVRNLNDLHHAKDAYIAGVLGRFTDNTVGQNLGAFRKEYLSMIYRANKLGVNGKTDKNRNGIVIDMMNLNYDNMLHIANLETDEYGNIINQELQLLSKEGEVIWSNKYLEKVKQTLEFNRCLLTKKTEEQANSDFFNQTIYPKNAKSSNPIPRKYVYDPIIGKKTPLPTDKYGFYTSVKSAYAIAIEYKNKNKTKREIVNIPLIEVYNNNVENYLKNLYGEYTVLKDKIYKNQLVKYKGQLCYFVSDSELHNATQIKCRKEWQYALSKICKAREKKKYIPDTIDNSEKEKYIAQMSKFVADYIEQLQERFPLYSNIASELKNYVEKGGLTALSFELKQKFILDLMAITSTKGFAKDMKAYSVSVNGEILSIKGSDIGRLHFTVDSNELEFIQRSITGFWQHSKGKV